MPIALCCWPCWLLPRVSKMWHVPGMRSNTAHSIVFAPHTFLCDGLGATLLRRCVCCWDEASLLLKAMAAVVMHQLPCSGLYTHVRSPCAPAWYQAQRTDSAPWIALLRTTLLRLESRILSIWRRTPLSPCEHTLTAFLCLVTQIVAIILSGTSAHGLSFLAALTTEVALGLVSTLSHTHKR